MARTGRLSPRKQPSQGRSRVTVEVIIEAAARVFERQGYAKTTTNHIADRAGVSIGSLYQYFPNKEAILVVLLEQHMSQVATALQEVRAHVESAPHDLRAVLRHYVDIMVEQHARNPRLQHVLLEEAPRPPHLHQLWHGIEQAMVQTTVELLQAHPQVRVRDARAAAYLLVQCVETLTHRFVVEPPVELPRERFVGELVDMLTRYLQGDAPGAASA